MIATGDFVDPNVADTHALWVESIDNDRETLSATP
jgi:hypothetical protein